MPTQCVKRAVRECIARARSPSPAPERGGGGEIDKEVRRSIDDGRLIAALKECRKSRDLRRGRELHRSCGVDCGGSVYVATTLVDMYARCGSMEEARGVFDGMRSRNVVSWTALILGYVENGRSEVALDLFERMEREGCRADARTFVAGIMACGNLAAKKQNGRGKAGGDGELVAALEGGEVAKGKKLRALERGREMHRRAAEAGCEMNLFVANTLVDMYSRCGDLVDARAVFDRMPCHSLVSWTTLLQGCVENGEEETALELFAQMQRSRGCVPDAQAFVAVLAACSSLAAKVIEGGSNEESGVLREEFLERGMAVHFQAEKASVTDDIFVANKLVDMYSKCGSMEDARRVFDRMICHDVVTWTSLILGYVENDSATLGLELFDRLATFQDVVRDPQFFVAGLMACESLVEKNKAVCLERLAFIHSQAGKSGCDSDIFVASTLVDLYAKCGSIENARAIFERMPRRDVVSWTSLLLGYVESAQGDMALKLFSVMQREGCAPDSRAYVAAFMACSSMAEQERKAEALTEGRYIHSKAVKDGFHLDKMVANSLVDMYARCGSMSESRKVFDEIRTRDVVSWNSLLQGYILNGENATSLQVFEEMLRKGCDPDGRTYVAVFKACGNLAHEKEESRTEWLTRGKEFHRQASRQKPHSDIFVANSLIDMYAKCGDLTQAQEIFDEMPVHDVVSWNTLLSAFADNGESETTLDLYRRMRKEKLQASGNKIHCRPDARTLIPVLKACSNAAALQTGREIHADAVRSGLESSPFLAASLVDFYGKCGGNMVQAELASDYTQTRNLSLWSALMAGYGRLGDTNQVLDLFQTVTETGLRLDGATFCSVLTACSHAGLVNQGKQLFHSMLPTYGVAPTLEHYHCLIDMLGRADSLEEAMAVVKAMPLRPSSVTWKTVLSACRKWQNVEIGKVAFEALQEMDENEEQAASTFTLMANIYAGAEMWEEQAKVLSLKKRHPMKKILQN